MGWDSVLRAGLVFAHLLLCVFALQAVLQADLRVLRRRIGTRTMRRTHRRVAWLLAGLWLTGLAIIGIDVGLDLGALAERPKLLTKLACVVALTLNGVLLHVYALPRITSNRSLSTAECQLMAVMGAVSTSSWLMAAFVGVTRPLAHLPLHQALGLYLLVLVMAGLVAIVLCAPLLKRRSLRSGHTAVEEAAETLDLAPPRAARS